MRCKSIQAWSRLDTVVHALTSVLWHQMCCCCWRNGLHDRESAGTAAAGPPASAAWWLLCPVVSITAGVAINVQQSKLSRSLQLGNGSRCSPACMHHLQQGSPLLTIAWHAGGCCCGRTNSHAGARTATVNHNRIQHMALAPPGHDCAPTNCNCQQQCSQQEQPADCCDEGLALLSLHKGSQAVVAQEVMTSTCSPVHSCSCIIYHPSNTAYACRRSCTEYDIHTVNLNKPLCAAQDLPGRPWSRRHNAGWRCLAAASCVVITSPQQPCTRALEGYLPTE